MISASISTTGNELYLQDLSKPNSKIIPVITHFDSDTYVLDNKGETLLLVTNLNAPNKRIVKVNANNPSPEKWIDVIPETENVLLPSKASGFIFANYM